MGYESESGIEDEAQKGTQAEALPPTEIVLFRQNVLMYTRNKILCHHQNIVNTKLKGFDALHQDLKAANYHNARATKPIKNAIKNNLKNPKNYMSVWLTDVAVPSLNVESSHGLPCRPLYEPVNDGRVTIFKCVSKFSWLSASLSLKSLYLTSTMFW